MMTFIIPQQPPFPGLAGVTCLPIWFNAPASPIRGRAAVKPTARLIRLHPNHSRIDPGEGGAEAFQTRPSSFGALQGGPLVD